MRSHTGEKTVTIGITGANSVANIQPVTGPKPKSAADFAAILDAFQNEAAKTPAERAREIVLKKHDMSEADYKALPQAKRDVIDREIADMVRKMTEEKTGVPIGERTFDISRLLG